MPPPTAMIAGTAHRMITGIFLLLHDVAKDDINKRARDEGVPVGNKWQWPPFSDLSHPAAGENR
jgi:hypothetical protein